MQGLLIAVEDHGAFFTASMVFLLIFGPVHLALISSSGKGCMAAVKGGTVARLNFLNDLMATLLMQTDLPRLLINPTVSKGLEKLPATFLIAFGVKLAIFR